MTISPVKRLVLETMWMLDKPKRAVKISKETGVSFPSVMMHIIGLTRMGYLESPEKGHYVISEKGRNAIAELVKVLKVEGEAEKIQNAIFSIAKAHGLQPRAFFKVIYTILLGVPHGPILGHYIITRGRQTVIDELEQALERAH